MDNSLSQEEIDMLLGLDVDEDEDEEQEEENQDQENNQEQEIKLSKEEEDALGEISNISMGTAATTLSSLVNQKVNITTPSVNIVDWQQLSDKYEKPCVAIEVQYKEGLIGTNFLILKEEDVKIITNLMMGGDGKNIDLDEPISELHLSAICEAMNQMVGSASTSMFSMFNKKIDILPPKAVTVDFELEDLPNVMKNTSLAQLMGDKFVQIQFNMVIGDIIDSIIMQIYPIEFAKDLYSNIVEAQGIRNQAIVEANKNIKKELGSEKVSKKTEQNLPKQRSVQADMNNVPKKQNTQRMDNMNYENNVSQNMSRDIDVQPVEFQQFDVPSTGAGNENIDLIMDVPLQISVELGRTKRPIKEILEFVPGSIVELDKLAGDPVDVLVNGKMVAKGEVVVIDENFAIRITEISNKKINIY